MPSRRAGAAVGPVGRGANPAEHLIRATGEWTLRFLCLVLAVTPLRTFAHTPGLARFRRMLGLLHFFWMPAGKNNFAEVAVYATIIAVLLGWRGVQFLKKKGLQRL